MPDPTTAAATLPSRRKHGLGFRLLLWLAPLLLDAYLRVVDWTSRKTVLHGDRDGCKLRGETTLFATLHQGFLYFVQHFRDRGGVVMASRSKDGDIIAAILSRLGYRSARGSDSKAGVEALDEMTHLLGADGVSGGLTVDGPRGPYGQVKMGCVVLARESGRPIVPCACWVTRRLILGNWDRTMIPLPFGRIFFAYGEPIRIPAEASWDELKALRGDIADRLLDLLFEVQEAAGEPRQDFRKKRPARA